MSSPTKLKINALDEQSGSLKGSGYTVSINPEQITHTREIKLNEEEKSNTAGGNAQYQGVGNETIAFDLFLDGTGVISSTSVEDEIKNLKDVIFDVVSEDHKPNYLLLSWKGINFYCQAKTFSITYTLFKPDGSPLRAKVSLSFLETLDPAKKQARAEQASPDMTHSFTVREGDALPLLCKQVYGRMDYYVQVAQYNGLTNFRELEVGSVLEFPPLQRN
ncbi:MAG: hypothetical protein H6581_16140 [Bacteroidia bacterium]|nr:hypothetical protein [Bacteroidia bacterium]